MKKKWKFIFWVNYWISLIRLTLNSSCIVPMPMIIISVPISIGSPCLQIGCSVIRCWWWYWYTRTTTQWCYRYIARCVGQVNNLEYEKKNVLTNPNWLASNWSIDSKKIYWTNILIGVVLHAYFRTRILHNFVE